MHHVSKDMEMSYKMDFKVCRVCLNNTATMSVFEKDDGIQYSTKIMRCVKIVISEDDGLPDSICGTCVNELSVSYEFIQKCEASDSALRLNIGALYDDSKNELEIKTEEIIKSEDIKQEFYNNDDLDVALQQNIVDNDHFDSNFPLGALSEYSDGAAKTQAKTKRKYQRHGKYSKVKREKSAPIQCVVCGLMVTSPSAMIIHMRTHTGEKPYSCSICDKAFKQKGSLKTHIENKHSERERKFICETCGNSFYRKRDIVIHMRIHTGERPYKCSLCSKSFTQITSMIRHRRRHTGEKPFPCPVCGKKFSDKQMVTKHQLTHSDEKKYACHICNNSLKSKSALTVHVRKHTEGPQNICSFCGRAFHLKANLQIHIKRKHSEKSGECPICSKAFSDLEVHMRKHTGEKPFVCAICNRAFGLKNSLSHHMMYKHGSVSGKFKCSVGDCTKTFPASSMLEFHVLKQHTNHTPYVCHHCSRGFYRASDLSRHLRVSHTDTSKSPLKANIT